ncbi:MAG: hypothetical protein WBQ08_07420 [Candidatus Sulfotelmatobacter sp.]
MDREALVYVDPDGVPHLMGRLWARTRKNKESATFEYDKKWLGFERSGKAEGACNICDCIVYFAYVDYARY